ncbi:MAG TPA: bifunctional glutamate N-acetyltransferase/amino-acid acetyltransferase ArgJ [Actinomycetota bacterium]|nr:bifunctional glutamate N-acetyltransferase/amino-acid acetyltransferase ArgJ [Actinomycetota bacterium]
MSVTFPRGFRAAGTSAGMKPSGRPDLGLLVADPDASAAGLFTTNAFAAAPVALSRERVAGGRARAVVVNSGQANAATGARGEADARSATDEVARALGVPAEEVLACSTGVIGEPLHLSELCAAIPALVGSLSPDGGPAFAEAILTTDTRSKQATAEAGPYRVGGCAKGVGMIAPDLRLATMLAFVTTDAPVPPVAVARLAAEVLEPAFESLTVDGCTSTNDTVLLLASGAAGGGSVEPGGPAWEALAGAIEEVARSLVAQLADDAEGASHVAVVEVSGARTHEDARVVAKAVAGSMLVKTALFGGDPNPGRILQAIGASGASVDPGLVRVRIGDATVVARGVVVPDYFAPEGARAARAQLGQRTVTLAIELGSGPGFSRALGVDLSYRYVEINAEYTT